MAQTQSITRRVSKGSNLLVVVPNAGLTTLMVLNVERSTRLGFQMLVAAQALAAFQVSARTHPDGAFFLISAAITGAAGLFTYASGTLATQAVGTGAFVMDTRGLYEVKIEATSGNVAGSTVSAYAEGQE